MALARKLRAGDREGFDAMYHQYGHRVMGFALRLCGGVPEAEDLIQDVFLAAYAARTSFQGRASVLSWLLGITARRWRDSRRRKVPSRVSSDEEPGPEHVERMPSGGSVEDQVVQSLMLSQSLAALAPPFREALLLVASQGLTYREAAEVLGEPAGTVKWRVSEAAKQMRRLMHAGKESDELQQSSARADRGAGSR